MTPRNVAGLNLIINDRMTYQSGGPIDWTLLQTAAQGLFQCSDLRDNVAAFMMNVPIFDGLTDYRSLSIASIYGIAASIMIIESKTLDVFAAISGHWHVPSRAWERMPSCLIGQESEAVSHFTGLQKRQLSMPRRAMSTILKSKRSFRSFMSGARRWIALNQPFSANSRTWTTKWTSKSIFVLRVVTKSGVRMQREWDHP